MPFTSSPISVKDATNATKTMIAYSDGTNSAFARPVLNSGGNIIDPATADLQTTGNASLATIASNTTGVATAAKQDTGNSSLATVATNTGNIDTAVGAKADSAASTDTGTFGVIALLKRSLQNWTTLQAKIPALVSSRVPVDGSGVTQPVSAASLPLPSGAATAAKQDTGNSSLATLVTNTTGLATATNQTSANTKLDSIVENTAAGGKTIIVTPTVTAGAYSTGTVVGGKISLSNAVRASGGAGIIQSVGVAKRTALTASFDVIFFNADPTNSTFTDNAALAVNVADLDKIIGVVRCQDIISLGTPQLLQGLNAGLPFSLASGTTLYAVAVIRGSETYASTNAVSITVDLIQN